MIRIHPPARSLSCLTTVVSVDLLAGWVKNSMY
jgi:hypothetical protein